MSARFLGSQAIQSTIASRLSLTNNKVNRRLRQASIPVAIRAKLWPALRLISSMPALTLWPDGRSFPQSDQRQITNLGATIATGGRGNLSLCRQPAADASSARRSRKFPGLHLL